MADLSLSHLVLPSARPQQQGAQPRQQQQARRMAQSIHSGIGRRGTRATAAPVHSAHCQFLTDGEYTEKSYSSALRTAIA